MCYACQLMCRIPQVGISYQDTIWQWKTWCASLLQDAIATSHEMLKRCQAMRQAQTDAGAATIMQSDSDAWCAQLLIPYIRLEHRHSFRLPR
jgi:hypothetical protein